jgi:tetratricopeptide (TPR) repeat protein
MQTNLADPTGAVNCCQAVIAMGDSVPSATMDVVRNRLIGLYLDTGDRDQAIAIVQQYINSSNAPTTITANVKKLIDSGASPVQCGQAANALRAKILASKGAVPVVEALQSSLINLLIRQGKPEEALQEARVLYFLSSDKGLSQAIDVMAQTFKAVDSNLARANQFLKFQKYGIPGEDGKVGTPDDMLDPLADIPAINDEMRVRTMTESMATLPLDTAGYRRRAEMYLFVDQHAEAFLALQKSLELCAMTTNELQSATDALTGLVVRRTKDVPLATQLVEFIMFGSLGKDGRVGTADDLKNPVPVILERLQYAQVQPRVGQTAVSGSVTPPVTDKISAPVVTPGG